MSENDGGSGAAGAHPATGSGTLWVIGWLFTIGFAGLSVGKAILALLLWPYYLGTALR